MPTSNATGDLHAQNPAPHLDTAPFGAPREPRWGGTKPEITPRRAAAIREKRAYEQALSEGLFDEAADASAFITACREARPLLLVAYVEVLAELTPQALRLFAGMLRVRRRWKRALLKHDDIATGIATSSRTARRAMVELLERGYVHVVAPAFDACDERYNATPELRRQALEVKAPHSRRANLYAVPDTVFDSVERICRLAKFGQASGTATCLERGFSGSGHPPPGPGPVAAVESAYSPCASTPCGQLGPESASPPSVSAARTVDFSAAAPAVVTAVALPARRQGETRSAVPEAPDGEGGEDLACDPQWRQLAALAAEGLPFAVEQLRELRRIRALQRRRGGGDGETN